MQQASGLEQIDIERLYRHILFLEEVRHPVDTLEVLNGTADYILAAFSKYGLSITEHFFTLEGITKPFRNVEGVLGDPSAKEELVIVSHYDSVASSPGANDNGSGVAGMLEIARVLAEQSIPLSVRFVGFTLEECNPLEVTTMRDKMLELGLVDDFLRPLTYHFACRLELLHKYRGEALQAGKSRVASWEYAVEKVSEGATPPEKEYFEFVFETNKDITSANRIGKSICLGSSYWVEKFVQKQRKSGNKIVGVINLEEIAYTDSKPRSQSFPKRIPSTYVQTYKVNMKKRVGNFIALLSDRNSERLARLFTKQCKNKDIVLPYLWVHLPMNYQQIAEKASDLIRSDHAPFWRANIPAIALTDTVNFRYPFYHTMADTIDKLDFDFLKKVCQATISTILNYKNK